MAALRLLITVLLFSAPLSGATAAGVAASDEPCGLPGRLRRVLSPVARSPSGIRGYFAMPRLFGEGRFDDIVRALPDIRATGTNTLWISPPHPQTTMTHPEFGFNNHGYWVSRHGKIDPVLGGEVGFRRLVREADRHGIRIGVDAVLNQFGYADQVRLGRKTVSTRDERYFLPYDPAGPVYHPREMEIWDALDRETDSARLRALQAELTTYPLYKFPTLRLENPEVFRYLLESYQGFVDRGIDVFRIDAAKHLRPESLARFINEMNRYAAAKGRTLTFFAEYFLSSSHSLDVLAKDVLRRIERPASLHFLDIPLAREFRRLEAAVGETGILHVHAAEGGATARTAADPRSRSLPVELPPRSFVIFEVIRKR